MDKVEKTELEEAADPSTDPQRLEYLINASRSFAVKWTAFKNPSLPEPAWRKGILQYEPEAWDNPMAPFYLISWERREEDLFVDLEFACFKVMENVSISPNRISFLGKELIWTKLSEFWASYKHPLRMLHSLGVWASAKGIGSPEHLRMLLLIIRIARKSPGLGDKESNELNRLESVARLGYDPRHCMSVESFPLLLTEISYFAYSGRNRTMEIANMVITEMKDRDGFDTSKEKLEECKNIILEIIRQEFPVPPKF